LRLLSTPSTPEGPEYPSTHCAGETHYAPGLWVAKEPRSAAVPPEVPRLSTVEYPEPEHPLSTPEYP
jgi:hypothetical protein